MDVLDSYKSALGSTTDISSQVQGLAQWMVAFVVISGIIGTAVFALYLYSTIRNWHVQQAILQLQKDVAEINQRQKAVSPQTTAPDVASSS